MIKNDNDPHTSNPLQIDSEATKVARDFSDRRYFSKMIEDFAERFEDEIRSELDPSYFIDPTGDKECDDCYDSDSEFISMIMERIISDYFVAGYNIGEGDVR